MGNNFCIRTEDTKKMTLSCFLGEKESRKETKEKLKVILNSTYKCVVDYSLKIGFGGEVRDAKDKTLLLYRENKNPIIWELKDNFSYTIEKLIDLLDTIVKEKINRFAIVDEKSLSQGDFKIVNQLPLSIELEYDFEYPFMAPDEEYSVMKITGEFISKMADILPLNLALSRDQRDILYFEISQRGTYIDEKTGIKKPSMFVKETENYRNFNGFGVPNLIPYEKRYLTCLNSKSNNYKFYELLPGANGISAIYGRIGADLGDFGSPRRIKNPFPTYMYWIRYYEKLSKGYKDISDLKYNNEKAKKKKLSSKKKNIEKREDENLNQVSVDLYNKLLAFAKGYVDNMIMKGYVDKITYAQVKECKKHFKELVKRKTVSGFNRQLREIIQLSPRKVSDTRLIFANSKDDFVKIIEREESLINALEVCIDRNENDTDEIKAAKAKDIFLRKGISISLAKENEKNLVISRLSNNLKQKVSNIYLVTDKEQDKKFKARNKKRGIREIKLLWHGSRNENWLSIIENSLSLHPNAIITGKMLGNGIYFGLNSLKSWNYTSFRGTYWANGHQNVAYMGLYEIAYGNPYNISTWAEINNCSHMNQSKLDTLNKDCIHAHAGHLKADEIVVYDEAAVNLKYIVEFKD